MNYKTQQGLLRVWTSLLAAILAGTMPLHADDINVFAASSLTDPLKAIRIEYEKQTGDKIAFNFDSSGTLARQIKEGAPADLFFSADEAKMDALDKAGRIVSESRKSVLGNQLVVIAVTNAEIVITKAADLTGPVITRIALGDPMAVPVGIYAKSYLDELGLWEGIKAKVIPTENAKAVLAAVESGNAQAGIVYKTDASLSDKVRVAYEVPVAEGPEIRYPLALTIDAPHHEAGQRFLEYLTSEVAADVFKKFGFILLK